MTAVDRATRIARRRWPTNTALQRAYIDGYLAGAAGRTIDACPYLSGRRRRARRGWRPIWRSIWVEGWERGSAARRP